MSQLIIGTIVGFFITAWPFIGVAADYSTIGLSGIISHDDTKDLLLESNKVLRHSSSHGGPFEYAGFRGWSVSQRLVLRGSELEEFAKEISDLFQERIEGHGFFIWQKGTGRPPENFAFTFGWTNGIGHLEAWVTLVSDEPIMADVLLVLSEVDYDGPVKLPPTDPNIPWDNDSLPRRDPTGSNAKSESIHQGD